MLKLAGVLKSLQMVALPDKVAVALCERLTVKSVLVVSAQLVVWSFKITFQLAAVAVRVLLLVAAWLTPSLIQVYWPLV